MGEMFDVAFRENNIEKVNLIIRALIGAVVGLLLLLKTVGFEEKGYTALGEEVKKIIYKD